MSMLQTAVGSFSLNRWPFTSNNTLRAWDAADEYLLQHVLDELQLHHDNATRMLLVNDAQGALATVLHACKPQSWSDSVISHQAASENLKSNRIEEGLRAVASTDVPEGPVNIVLIKVPKTTSLLEDQLFKLRYLCDSNTRIIAAGMVKHLQKSAFTAFERSIGPVTTSLAKKKARLLFITFDAALEPSAPPYPNTYRDDDVARPLINHANVFSRDHLDHGSRFLIQHFHALPASKYIVDLACGNGVLGLLYQQAFTQSTVHFVDESYLAVESARSNHAAWFPDGSHQAKFAAADGQTLQLESAADLVLCNPPFHQQHAVGDQIARRLFGSAKRCLRQHGELWLVANRHLDYPAALRQQFKNCLTIATNRKFAIYRAIKR